MQVVRKFIINRNNINFIYVEHLLGNFNYSSYHVYNNSKNYECLSPNDFYLIYGNDDKLCIYDYVNELECDITSYTTNDNNGMFYLNVFSDLKKRLKIMNEFNPNLKGYKATLLSSIDYYNEVIVDKKNEIEYDYEREIKRLNGEDIEDLTRSLINEREL